MFNIVSKLNFLLFERVEEYQKKSMSRTKERKRRRKLKKCESWRSEAGREPEDDSRFVWVAHQSDLVLKLRQQSAREGQALERTWSFLTTRHVWRGTWRVTIFLVSSDRALSFSLFMFPTCYSSGISKKFNDRKSSKLSDYVRECDDTSCEAYFITHPHAMYVLLHHKTHHVDKLCFFAHGDWLWDSKKKCYTSSDHNNSAKDHNNSVKS